MRFRVRVCLGIYTNGLREREKVPDAYRMRSASPLSIARSGQERRRESWATPLWGYIAVRGGRGRGEMRARVRARWHLVGRWSQAKRERSGRSLRVVSVYLYFPSLVANDNTIYATQWLPAYTDSLNRTSQLLTSPAPPSGQTYRQNRETRGRENPPVSRTPPTPEGRRVVLAGWVARADPGSGLTHTPHMLGRLVVCLLEGAPSWPSCPSLCPPYTSSAGRLS